MSGQLARASLDATAKVHPDKHQTPLQCWIAPRAADVPMEPPLKDSTVLEVLQRLHSLLLGPDSEDEDLQPTKAHSHSIEIGNNASISLTAGLPDSSCGSPASDSQQLLLQQLLQAALTDSPAAVAAFNPSTGHPAAYQLLLSSLADGHLEAAQLLLLLQLQHTSQLQQERQHRQTDQTDLDSSNSNSEASSSRDTGVSVVWPEFVLRRLSDMALAVQGATDSTGTSGAAAAAAMPVVALRLLGAAAAVAGPAPDQALSPALARPITAAIVAAAAAAAADPAVGMPSIVSQTSASLGVSTAPGVKWLVSLSPAGIAAVADLATNCARTHEAKGLGSSDTTVDNTSCSNSFVANVAQLQLKLLQYIQHPTAPAQTVGKLGVAAAAGTRTSAAAELHGSSSRSSSSSSRNITLMQQINMLLNVVHVDNLDTSHFNSNNAAARSAAVVPSSSSSSSSSSHVGVNRSSGRVAASPKPIASCCSAAQVILGNLTTMVLEHPQLTRDKHFVKGVHDLVQSLIQSSPTATSPQVDWSGKQSGFALKPAAAQFCRSGSRQLTAAAAAAAAMTVSCSGSCTWSAESRRIYLDWLRTLDQISTVHPSSSSSSSSSGSSSATAEFSQDLYPRSLLESALVLLLALITTGGRPTAAELYRYDISNTLDRLRNFSTSRVLDLCEKLYGHMCLFSSQMRDEVLQDGSILALSGILKVVMSVTTHQSNKFQESDANASALAVAAAPVGSARAAVGVSPLLLLRLLLAALSRLAAVVDAAAGAEMLWFTGASSNLRSGPAAAAAAAAAATRHLSTYGSRTSVSARSVTGNSDSSSSRGCYSEHLQHVLGSSSSGLAAVITHMVMKDDIWPPAHQQQQQQQQQQLQQIQIAACQVFLAVLNRSRSMQHLSQAQVPKGGLCAQLGPDTVRLIQHLAINPSSSSSSSSSSDDDLTKAERSDELAAAAATVSSSSSRDIVAVQPGNSAIVRRTAAASSSSRSPGRRRAGSATAGAAAAGSNAKTAEAGAKAAAAALVAAAGDYDEDYDEDGLRVVWSSGPSAAVASARSSWKLYSLADLLSWTQSSTDLDVRLLLPAGTPKNDVIVSIQPDRLTVRLAWYGRVLDGPLAKRIKSSEAHWTLDKTTVKLKPSSSNGSGISSGDKSGASNAGGGGSGAVAQEFTELQLLLPKEVGGRFWRALFEGGVEKSHLEVLQEAIINEDDARCGPTVDELGPEAALLYEELRERQELMVGGHWDIERSFDDFRLVIGDNTV